MAVEQRPDPEKYDEQGIAIDMPRPVGPGGQLQKDQFAMIPQHYKYGYAPLPPNDPSNPYAQMPTTPAIPADNKVAASSAANNAPQAKAPTTAAADPAQRLPEAVNTTDPDGKSQVLANMMKAMLTIAMLMSLASNSSNKRQTMATPTGKIVSNAFGAALAILSKRYTAEKVLAAFDSGFGEFGILQIHAEYVDIVHAALSKLIQDIIIHGDKNIPTLIIPAFTYGTNVPTPLYTFPPDMYVKQYEPQEEADFPGYILWVGPAGSNPARVWTQRTPEQPPYTSADQEVLTTSAYQIADALDSAVKNGSVTPELVNSVLDGQATAVQNHGMNLVVGHNSSNNLMNNLSIVLGLLSLAVQIAQQLQVSKGVTDAGKMAIAATAFARNIAMIKQMKAAAGGAFGGMTAIAGLGALASIVGGFINGGIPSPAGGGVGSLFNNNISTNSFISNALGAAVTVAGVAAAMKYSRSGPVAISSASNLIRNLGIK